MHHAFCLYKNLNRLNWESKVLNLGRVMHSSHIFFAMRRFFQAGAHHPFLQKAAEKTDQIIQKNKNFNKVFATSHRFSKEFQGFSHETYRDFRNSPEVRKIYEDNEEKIRKAYCVKQKMRQSAKQIVRTGGNPSEIF